jgi:hypothetical protein
MNAYNFTKSYHILINHIIFGNNLKIQHMNYQTYYKGIKDQLAKYSDVVYYEPLSEKEIQAIEKQIGTTIKSLFREYLLAFGFTQDIFEKVTALKDSWLDDVEFIRNSYPDYLPIFCDIEEDDTLYLIKNIDSEDDEQFDKQV